MREVVLAESVNVADTVDDASQDVSQDETNVSDMDIRIIETIEIVYDEVETLKSLVKHLGKTLAVIRDDIESIKDTNEKLLQTLMLSS